MRILKAAMVLMIALVVLTLGLVGYFFATARVNVASYKVSGAYATDNAAQFEQLRAQVEQGTFEGTLFNSAQMGGAENYAFITYTLKLSNQCLVPVDMVEVQVVPDPADVLQVGDHTVYSLDAKTTGDVKATILTARDSHSIRELIVTYYVWGVSFSIRETYGG